MCASFHLLNVFDINQLASPLWCSPVCVYSRCLVLVLVILKLQEGFTLKNGQQTWLLVALATGTVVKRTHMHTTLIVPAQSPYTWIQVALTQEQKQASSSSQVTFCAPNTHACAQLKHNQRAALSERCTHTHLTEGVIEHWNAWGDIKPQQRCVLFMLNWLVRDEVLNQKNEVERHREREGYRASECITRLLKDDVSDRAQLCCEDLVLVGFCELRECENLCSLTRVSMNVKKKKTRGKKRKVY